jgi:hypothetical protein
MPVLFEQLDVNAGLVEEERHPAAPPRPVEPPCAGGTGQGGARWSSGRRSYQWYAGQGCRSSSSRRPAGPTRSSRPARRSTRGSRAIARGCAPRSTGS